MPLSESLLLKISQGACLLVPSRRHLRRLRQEYDEAMLATGVGCWPTADILTVDAWLQTLHQGLLSTGTRQDLLLSDLEAITLWEATAPEGLEPMQSALHQAARQARQSWLALRVHHGTLRQVAAMDLNTDQQQFLAWAQRVEARLADSRLIDPGCLSLYLQQHANRLLPVRTLLLHRLPRLTPALEGLLAGLKDAGWAVELTDEPAEHHAPSLYQAVDRADERGAWLAWARDRLVRDPNSRIAVITPELGECRAAVERELLSVLQPELDTPGHTAGERVFDLPGGNALSALGIIQTLLDLLRVGTSPSIEWPTISRLLRSRYLGLEESDRLEAFEAALRKRCLPSFSPQWLVGEAQRCSLTLLAEALAQGLTLLRPDPLPRPADEWVQGMSACLGVWGWPGRESLDSDEYQAVEAASAVLRDLASAADLLGPIEGATALALLSRHLQVPFQPERGTPRLWLFDRYVDPGMDFDALWVAGLTANRWPEAAALDPLLPRTLQRTLGLPGTDTDEHIREARRLLDSWACRAAELVFSWPAVEDEAAQAPSPLLGGNRAYVPAPPINSRAQQLIGTALLEPIPLTPVDRLSGPIRGGSKLLEWQSACPFRAFAQLRVAAGERAEPEEGVNHALRGTILHAALRLFWDQTRDRQGLLSLTPEARLERADSCVRQALDDHAGHRLGPRAMAVEATWQLTALQRTIEHDLQRRAFEVVGTEQKHTVELAGLQIDCSVDRVDRIDGQLLVIDYKTSKTLKTASWFGRRPEAPQLPLYATAAVGEAAAIAFCQVSSSGARLLGVGCELEAGIASPLSAAPEPNEEPMTLWRQQQRDWALQLTALATDLAEGVAEVDPRAEEDCRHCHLRPACRVHWLSIDGESAESEE
ncbi:MAG: PD-(D/E)XK nuclease family protein [Steroidobacteraceae bacterium]